MILLQFLHQDPIAASYLFGCVGKSAAAVVDPVGEIEPYLGLADQHGMKIRYVIDTHVHADHLSPGRGLAGAARADYVLHADAPVDYPFRGVRDGEVLDLGNVSVQVLHTPGHTPEHISLLVTDRTRAEEPWLVFTGHTLMVGGMGRTELASSAEEGAAALFESAERLRLFAAALLVLMGSNGYSMECAWVIPMRTLPEIARAGPTKYVVCASRNPGSTDRFVPFRCHTPEQLTARILSLMEGGS